MSEYKIVRSKPNTNIFEVRYNSFNFELIDGTV